MTEARTTTLNRLEKQLTTIEHSIESLIERADLSELSSAECLNIAIKFMTQHNRVLTLKNSLLCEQPDKRQNVLVGALMRQMRGEGEAEGDNGGIQL